jgi:hypothetical protein
LAYGIDRRSAGPVAIRVGVEHDRAESEFIRRKFDAAGLPCSVISLTAPSKSGVRYLLPDHNGPAREILATAFAESA